MVRSNFKPLHLSFDSLDRKAQLTKLASGFGFTEGPVLG